MTKALGALLVATWCVACGSNDPARGDTASMTGGDGLGGAGSNGTSAGAGGAMTSGGSAGASGGAVGGPGGSSNAGSGGTPIIDQPRPGCGLPAAAFCETFDTRAQLQGRGGELDRDRWSGSRLANLLASGVDNSAIGQATIPPCRSDLPAKVLPPQDAVICDANADLPSRHLLMAVASQNYGQNSYRIRQPFDFAGRTGKIVFDAEAYIMGSLLGWISVEVVEDPTSAPSFAIQPNYEGTVVPRNGFELQFESQCSGHSTPPDNLFTLRMLQVFHDYALTVINVPKEVCLGVLKGKLNHFEVEVSQNHIDVYATPVAADGKTFPKPTLLLGADVQLPFSRGYVSITTHNHATIKYSANHDMDAWTSRWDNVGFDGPIIRSTREYEIPDSLMPGGIGGQGRTMGYRVNDVAKGPSGNVVFHGVDLSQAQSARLVLTSYTQKIGGAPSTFVIRYRLNGHAWHDYSLAAGQVAAMTDQGLAGQAMPVDLADLVAGDNTVELVTANVPLNYPPAAANIDLVITTN